MILWLLACQPRLVEPSPVRQAGQITLTQDASRGTTRLRVLLYESFAGPLPSERQGLPMDACATLVPTTSSQATVYRDAEVRAWCGGQEIELTEHAPGSWARKVDPAAAGLSCEVTIDGEPVEVPPLPEVPDVEVRRTGLVWTPADGDEVRVSVPRSGGRSTLCRLVDDGEGPRPKGIGLQTSFVSRVALAAPALEGGRVPVASIAGAWLRPED